MLEDELVHVLLKDSELKQLIVVENRNMNGQKEILGTCLASIKFPVSGLMYATALRTEEYLMSSGYEQIYESLIPKLGKCDFLEVAKRLDLSSQPDGALSVYFLGREYEISSRGVNPTDGKPVNVNNRNVLAYYTLSKGVGEPAFSYVPISFLAGTEMVFNTNIKWMTDPLGKIFSGNYVTFSETMCKLGGVFRWGFLRQAEIGRLFMAFEGIAENSSSNCLL